MEFTISYSSKTFTGIITAGVMKVTADNIETVKENAFDIIVKKYKDDADEDEMWHANIQNLTVAVSPVK